MNMASKLLQVANLEAGLEVNIAEQKDPKFINEASAYIDTLKNIYEKDTKIFKDTASFLNISKEAKEIVSNLSILISDRIGIDFTILGDSTGNACVFSIAPSNYNVIKEESATMEEVLKQAIKDMRDLKHMSGDSTREKDAELDMESFTGLIKIYESMLKSTKSINETLKVDSVKFDLNKATVTGLPKDFKSIIALDFVYFLQNSSVREILAILLHEVGHQYTHLLNMYRIARTNTILKDCTAFAKDGDIGKIEIALKKEFDVVVPKFNNFKDEDNIKEVKVFITTLLSKTSIINANESSYSSRDSEALADQFATKFGLGPELVTGLNKIINTNYTELDYFLGQNIWNGFLMFNAIVAIFYIAFSFVVFAGVGGFTIGAISTAALGVGIGIFLELSAIVFVFIIATNVYRFFSGGNDAFEAVYDDKKRRLERIRNDAIRMLNSLILSADSKDKAMILEKMNNIHDMDRIIDNTRKNRAFVDLAGDLFFSSNRRHSIETLVQQILENLNANKLTMLGAKLEQL